MLTINDIRTPDGHLRPDLDTVERLVEINLDGVHEVHYTNALTSDQRQQVNGSAVELFGVFLADDGAGVRVEREGLPRSLTIRCGSVTIRPLRLPDPE